LKLAKKSVSVPLLESISSDCPCTSSAVALQFCVSAVVASYCPAEDFKALSRGGNRFQKGQANVEKLYFVSSNGKSYFVAHSKVISEGTLTH
jgi:hypothetical protein